MVHVFAAGNVRYVEASSLIASPDKVAAVEAEAQTAGRWAVIQAVAKSTSARCGVSLASASRNSAVTQAQVSKARAAWACALASFRRRLVSSVWQPDMFGRGCRGPPCALGTRRRPPFSAEVVFLCS